MSWNTTVSVTRADGFVQHLGSWHGETLFGHRVAESDDFLGEWIGDSAESPEPRGQWIGALAEQDILTTELRGGYPDRYEVTAAGAIAGLERLFPTPRRTPASSLMPDVDALIDALRELPADARVRIESWDQS